MIDSLVNLFGSASASRIDALSRQVADASIDEVCSLVSGQIESMTFSEARGYVRARAPRIVRKQTHLAIQQIAAGRASWTDAVVRAATERMIPLVIKRAAVGVPQAPAKIRLAA